MGKKAVVALFGPTAVGKTAVAVALGEALQARGRAAVAISADALQLYRGLELLTGAPTPEQQRRLPHRLVSFLPPSATFSAGQYAKLAHAEIDRAIAEGKVPIVVGGTGLYLLAALCRLDLRPPAKEGVRERLAEELARLGPEALYRQLAARAPEVARRIAPRDRQRILRALELLASGKRPAGTGLWRTPYRQPTLLVGLTLTRAALFLRIDRRVEEIAAKGGRQEVEAALQAGASQTVRKALGFQELLRGDLERMKLRTRRYAKRQLTWMRKLRGVRLLDVGEKEPAQVAAEILALLGDLPPAGRGP